MMPDPVSSQVAVDQRTVIAGEWVVGLCPGERPFLDASPPLAGDPAIDVRLLQAEGRAGFVWLLEGEVVQAQHGEFAPESAESVAEAFAREGPQVLRGLAGRFAAVGWDSDRQALICASDSLGSLPLFVAAHRGQVLVSPSVGRLCRVAQQAFEIDRVVLAEWLMLRFHDPSETCFRTIRRLASGLVIALYADGSIEPLARTLDLSAGSEHESSNRRSNDATPVMRDLDSLLERAVERLIDRRSAGVLLSGGVDSVAVLDAAVVVADRHGTPKPTALSFFVPEASCLAERWIQRAVAQRLGIHQVLLPADSEERGMFTVAFETSANWPTPLLNFWNPTQRRLLDHGRRLGCRIVLTGVGGDEWLAVNPRAAADFLCHGDLVGLMRLYRSQRQASGGRRLSVAGDLAWRGALRPLLREVVLRTILRWAPRRGGEWWQSRHDDSLPSWVGDDPALREQLLGRRRARSLELGSMHFHRDAQQTVARDPYWGLLQQENLEQGLRTGVRLREPLWDPELVSRVVRTSSRELLGEGCAKALLRQRLCRQFPDLGFTSQPKFDYERFVYANLRQQAAPLWSAVRRDLAVVDHGLVSGDAVHRRVESLLEAPVSDALHGLWALLSVESWLRGR